jgi:hypothetical protein
MTVSEVLSFRQYDADPRFQKKKPYRTGSRKQSCGDNIYSRNAANTTWMQRDSFHTLADGGANAAHVKRDTAIDRILIGSDFVYFGGEGPKLPTKLRDSRGKSICKTGRGVTCFDDQTFVKAFVTWLRSLEVAGYQGAPFEWLSLRR